MNHDIERIIYTELDILNAVKKMGQRIAHDYEDRNPILIAVLKGSVIFFSDLIRAIQIPLEIDFIRAVSYGMEACSSGRVKIVSDLTLNIENRHIIIVEDIIDTATTLSHLLLNLRQRNPASVSIAALLDKNIPKEAEVNADYICFEVENEFVVGYGLDYAEQYRNLPYIGVLKRENYE